MFPYNAIKAGIEGMTRALALDLGPAIRVNAVAPGFILVEHTENDLSDAERDRLAGLHPSGRLGRPEDIANAVLFLMCPESEFLTGETITVDGGRQVVLQDDLLPDYTAGRDR
jgi:NAD(P)-dependent dehydrogenase (short-subunit alcohol dehydrogenase family)